jgi:hypothetical protein
MPKVRTTITIDQEALSRYESMAKVSGDSLSSFISDWLMVTSDAAQDLAIRIRKVKDSPEPVAAAKRLIEALRVVEEGFESSMHQLGRGRGAVAGQPSGGTPPPPAPPSCNTGGKVVKTRSARASSK